MIHCSFQMDLLDFSNMCLILQGEVLRCQESAIDPNNPPAVQKAYRGHGDYIQAEILDKVIQGRSNEQT